MGKKSREKRERRSQKSKAEVSKKTDSKSMIMLIVILVAFTGILYWKSMYNDFVNLDDNEHVYNNPLIKNLNWENIKEMFTGARMGNWIPLTQLSFTSDYLIFGMDPWGFHFTNFIFHILNTVLVFWLFFLLTKDRMFAFLIGLMFSFHPLHVESVAWITERKDVLYAFFYLLAMISWIFWREKNKKGYLALTFVSFILSLLSKSMAVTLPAVLILIDVFHFKRKLNKSVIDKLVFFLLSFAAVAITWHATYSSTTPPIEVNLFERLIMSNYAFLFYPFKMLFPFRLSAIYPHPVLIHGSIPLIYFLLPLVTLALILTIRFAKNNMLKFGFWIYLIMILPVIQLLPLAGTSFTCDRFTYLPGLGMFIIFLSLFKETETNKKFRTYLVLTICLVWGVLSWMRISVWKNGIILHSDIIEKYPQIELPYINRGKAYGERGEHGKAIADFSSAISIKPASADAYNNRGNEYGELSQYDRAIADLTNAIELRKDFSEAFSNRGHVLMQAGRFEDAESDFTKAINLNPAYASGWYNRGNLYRKIRNFQQAIDDYSQALKFDEHMAEAYNNRGTAKTMIGDFKSAVNDFNIALQLEPDNLSFLNNRGNAYKDMGNNNKALNDFNTAIRLQPRYSNAYHNRAVLYYDAGDYQKAGKDLNTVKKLNGYVNPAFEQALQNAMSGN